MCNTHITSLLSVISTSRSNFVAPASSLSITALAFSLRHTSVHLYCEHTRFIILDNTRTCLLTLYHTHTHTSIMYVTFACMWELKAKGRRQGCRSGTCARTCVVRLRLSLKFRLKFRSRSKSILISSQLQPLTQNSYQSSYYVVHIL